MTAQREGQGTAAGSTEPAAAMCVECSDDVAPSEPSREDTGMNETSATDQGPNPFVVDIEAATLANDTYRTTLWTGSNLQLTVMAIQPGHDIGLEVHHDHDQFLRIEAGTARVQMGGAQDDLSFDRTVEDDWVVLIPAGTWHNVTNTGETALKVYSLYGPPEHPHGTVHETRTDADKDPHE